MKYPLTRTQQALRFLKCWLVGHKVKRSWGADPDYYKEPYLSDHSLIPYGKRLRNGNGLWKFHAWWKVKCKVCRLTNRETSDLPDSLHIRLFRSIKNHVSGFIFDLKIGFEYAKGYKKLFVPFYAILRTLFNECAYQQFINHKFGATFVVLDYIEEKFSAFLYDE